MEEKGKKEGSSQRRMEFSSYALSDQDSRLIFECVVIMKIYDSIDKYCGKQNFSIQPRPFCLSKRFLTYVENYYMLSGWPIILATQCI